VSGRATTWSLIRAARRPLGRAVRGPLPFVRPLFRGPRPGAAAPRFPLVGIVRRDRAEFDQQPPPGHGCRGVEDTMTSPRTESTFTTWAIPTRGLARNAAVLIHEATHQTAFNTGVHSRYTPPPRWLAEGCDALRGAGRPRFRRASAGGRSSQPRPLRDFQQHVAPRHRPNCCNRSWPPTTCFAETPARPTPRPGR